MTFYVLTAVRPYKLIQSQNLGFQNFYALYRRFHVGKPCYPRRTPQNSPKVSADSDLNQIEGISPWSAYVDKSVKNDSLENHITTPFGHVRIDAQNAPKYHGQQDRHDFEKAETSGEEQNLLFKNLESSETDEVFGTSSEIFVPQFNASKPYLKEEPSSDYDYFKESAEGFKPRTINFVDFKKASGNANLEKKNDKVDEFSQNNIEKNSGLSSENLFDQHYFDNILNNGSDYQNLESPSTKSIPSKLTDKTCLNEIDKQYFSRDATLWTNIDRESHSLAKEIRPEHMKQIQINDVTANKEDKLNFIDEQIFGGAKNTTLKTSIPIYEPNMKTKLKKPKREVTKKTPTALDFVKKMRKEFTFDAQSNSFVQKNTREQEISQIGESLQRRIGRVVNGTMKEGIKDKKGSVEENNSPLENVEGRVSERFLPTDLERLTSAEVENIIQNSVIYNDHDIVAIHKPYGLQMFGESKQSRFSVESLLKCLYNQVNVEKTDDWPGLMPVHRLDKNTTGILLLAKTKESHKILSNLFHQRKIKKVYWAILNGTPDIDEGIIDIPLGEIKLKDRHRVTLRPDYSHSNVTNKPNYKGDTFPAVTEFSVIKRKGNSCLVEARPSTGFKHQIRAHFGLGMSNPILGDHKYSRIAELEKPQKVHGDILRRLEVRRSRSRDLPLCLHAKRILIPEIVEGRHVSIECSLPHFFVRIMKKLGLKPSQMVH